MKRILYRRIFIPSMLGSYWFLCLACVASIAVAIGGLWHVRRKVSRETLIDHHDVAAAMLSIVGTLYAVVLGLVVVGSLTKFEQARGVVGHEASSLRDIFTLSSGLPLPLKKQMHQHCIDYATTVSGEEWKLMEDGLHSENADRIMDNLVSEIVNLHPTNSGDSNLQGSLLTQLDELDDARSSRTNLASPQFDPIIWSVLIIGAIVVVVFTYFFGVKNFKIQVMMTALVTLVLALNMTIVDMFAYPFSGDVRVRPIPFQVVLTSFQRVRTQDLNEP